MKDDLGFSGALGVSLVAHIQLRHGNVARRECLEAQFIKGVVFYLKQYKCRAVFLFLVNSTLYRVTTM